MTLTQITEKGIKDGEIVNADINASAAIAGSKISPAFTSDITGTGDLTLSAGGTDRLTMTHAGGGKFVIKNPSAADLAFGTANENNELVIANGGNVGIGTGTPSGPLHVYKSSGSQRSYFESGDQHSFLRVIGGTSTKNTGIEFYSDSSNTANITALNTNALQFDVGTVNNAMYINSSGNVGVATTNPTKKLHVISSDYQTARFESTADDANGSYIEMNANSSSPADNDILGVLAFRGNNSASENLSYAHIRGIATDVTDGTEDGDILFHTRNNGTFAERVRINSSGNVGIGTDSPQRQLHVLSSTGDALVRITSADGHAAYIELGDASDGDAGKIVYDSANNLTFSTTNSGLTTEKLRITSAGKVGIGTTSLGTANLTIKGTTNAYGGVGNATVSVGAALQLEDDQGRKVSFWAPKTGEGAIGSITNHDFVVVTGNAEKARFSNNTGDFSLANGNLVFSTSGTGIDFGATSDTNGKTSELLDDYEEGTWIPVASQYYGGAITATYSVQSGFYVKIGKLVHVEFRLQISGVTNNGSNIQYLDGLPFLPDANRSYHAAGSVGFNTALTNDYISTCFVHPDFGGCVYFTEDGRKDSISNSVWQGGQLFGSLVYMAA